MVNEAFIGDTVTFEITVQDASGNIEDISGASTKQIKLRDPSGTSTAYGAGFTTDGKDGKMEYTVANTILNASGLWKFQGYVVLASGEWHGTIHRINILSPL